LRAPPLSLAPDEGIAHLQRASTARRLGEALPGAGRGGYRTTATRGSRMTDIETPVLDTLVQMSANTLERSRLDPETFMLLRIAALASVGAAPTSYAANLGAADEFGVEPDKVQGTLVAIAPVVGTARVAEAALAIATSPGVQFPVEGLEG
jgi:4-carboxymuconolactone decarboxylase